MSLDKAQKRGKYIGKVNPLLQEFHYVQPNILTKLINVYATSFYGAGTWDIFSSDCERLYKSWNVTIRQVFDLDRCTHRYLIEHVSGCLHPRVMLASRLVTFHKSLVTSNKFPVRFLSRLNETDLRTVLGRNIRVLLDECGLQRLDQLSTNNVKKNCCYFNVPMEQQWRLPLISELLQVKNNNLNLGEYMSTEVEDMLKYLCTS